MKTKLNWKLHYEIAQKEIAKLREEISKGAIFRLASDSTRRTAEEERDAKETVINFLRKQLQESESKVHGLEHTFRRCREIAGLSPDWTFGGARLRDRIKVLVESDEKRRNTPPSVTLTESDEVKQLKRQLLHLSARVERAHEVLRNARRIVGIPVEPVAGNRLLNVLNHKFQGVQEYAGMKKYQGPDTTDARDNVITNLKERTKLLEDQRAEAQQAYERMRKSRDEAQAAQDEAKQLFRDIAGEKAQVQAKLDETRDLLDTTKATCSNLRETVESQNNSLEVARNYAKVNARLCEGKAGPIFGIRLTWRGFKCRVAHTFNLFTGDL